MMRAILSVVLAIGVAAPAMADVTLKQTTSGKGMGMTGGGTMATTYIKGLKMRTDTVVGDATRTMIFDVEARKMYMFDSKKKESQEVDMELFAADIGRNVQADEMKASLKANGQTRQIGGRSAAGYDMDISVPAVIGGEKGMKMTVMMTGPMWIVKGAPGSADYARFYKGAAEKGFIFSDPSAAKGSPGQAKAMAEMYRQMADIGGVPYETEMSIKMVGDGPMAAMMARMGGMAMTTSVQSVDTETLSADLFAPPAGYKVTTKK